MSYDLGSKFISRHTGLSGVESKNIAKQLEHQGLDYQSFDWKTIGEDIYGHGKRVGGVKHHLKQMYGISLEPRIASVKHETERFSEMEASMIMPSLMEINSRRSPKSRMMDYSIGARRTFKPTSKRGVALWKKHPNRFDIIGVDDKI